MTRTGNPGHTVIVGWTFSVPPTTWRPVWLMLSEAPRRSAWARSFPSAASVVSGAGGLQLRLLSGRTELWCRRHA